MQKFLAALLTTGLIASCLSSSANRAAAAKSSAVDDTGLLAVGRASKVRAAAKLSSPNIKVVSYNIRWRSGDDLHQVAQLLKDDPEIGGAAIIGLQEVDRNKKRSGNKNSAEILAEELGMYYAWAAPPVSSREKEEETGVALLSAHPLTAVTRHVLPHKGPGGRRRVAIGATITVDGRDIRVYSVHSETRIKTSHKLAQMKFVIDELGRYKKNMPAIILGDLNTWEPGAVDKTFKLFTASSFQTPFDKQSTFSRRALFIPIELKLDWIWLRNLEATSHGIDQTIKLSDHFPLWLTFAFR